MRRARHNTVVVCLKEDAMRLVATAAVTAALFVTTIPFPAFAQDSQQQAARAQQAAPAPAAPVATPQAADNKIYLSVQVAPKSGGAVPGLAQQGASRCSTMAHRRRSRRSTRTRARTRPWRR